jgi:small subunit ribosomal protein S8
MAMTDPLGDMLTRIRNAQMRSKDRISTPASKLRGACSRCCGAKATFADYSQVELSTGKSEYRDRAEIFRWCSGDPPHRARVEAGPPRLCRCEIDPARRQRPRYLDPVDAQGVMADHEAREKNVGGELLCRSSEALRRADEPSKRTG